MPHFVRCALCNSDDTVRISSRAGSKSGKKKDVPTVLCLVCGLLYNNPMPNADELVEYYHHDYPAYAHSRRGYEAMRKDFMAHEKRRRETSALVFNFMRPYLRDGARILEIGSSAGYLLETVADRISAHIVGLEPNPDIARISRERLPAANINDMFFEEFAEQSRDTFNLVIMQHVFEHARDPNRWLRDIRRLVTDTGYIYIALPIATDFKPSRGLEDSLEFGHVYHYSPYTLYRLLNKHGFKIVKWAFDYALSYQIIATPAENPVDARPYAEFMEGSDRKDLMRRLQSQDRRHFLFRFKRKFCSLFFRSSR